MEDFELFYDEKIKHHFSDISEGYELFHKKQLETIEEHLVKRTQTLASLVAREMEGLKSEMFSQITVSKKIFEAEQKKQLFAYKKKLFEGKKIIIDP